ncbi:MAG TPA: hypothetical protein VGV07_05170 [Devosia sp.]|uniref:hypothetical protein n=1 Tax=Devosia sp. TaxID=1871048 RepID=UPI002DDCA3FD|nr:hypothetical protein [Devosia sp.]HEV2514617.1 hypothetical protein [Devosia sp.]
MHCFVAAAALCLVATPSLAQMVTISPEQIGEIFCIARLGNDMAPVQGLLTTELGAAIAEAEAKNAAIQQAHPDEKPPLGDGIPWQAFPDYATECKAGAVTLEADRAVVDIAYGFADYPDANFTDHLQLILVAQPDLPEPLWRIENLGYATEGDLRQVLVSAFAN